MAGDISRFAGHAGELLIGGSELLFDDIQFSNQPIPEPRLVGWFSLGILFLKLRLRKFQQTVS